MNAKRKERFMVISTQIGDQLNFDTVWRVDFTEARDAKRAEELIMIRARGTNDPDDTPLENHVEICDVFALSMNDLRELADKIDGMSLEELRNLQFGHRPDEN